MGDTLGTSISSPEKEFGRIISAYGIPGFPWVLRGSPWKVYKRLSLGALHQSGPQVGATLLGLGQKPRDGFWCRVQETKF